MVEADQKGKILVGWWLLAGYGLLLTAWLYGSALSLPFFFDDFVHLPYVQSHTLAQIWGETAVLAYYRPLNFTLWRIAYLLQGGFHAPTHHALNLALFWLNGWLVGWLADHLWREKGTAVAWPRIFLSATLYWFYPFGYQAVPWPGSLSHLLVLAFILASVTTYWQGRNQPIQQRGWFALSLLCAIGALFTHENGVLVAPLIASLEWTTSPAGQRWGNGIRRGLVWALPLLIWFPLWRTSQKVGSGSLLNGFEALVQNSTYFGQGMAYPLTHWGNTLKEAWGWSDLHVVWLLAGVALLGMVVIHGRSRHSRSLFVAAWVGLAVLPAIATLKFEYVINGPRLLTVASAGLAWGWAELFWQMGQLRPTAVWRSLTIVALLALLWQNSQFIHSRMVLHQRLGQAFAHAIEATQAANADGATAVLINFPSWFATAPTYALGHEGVLFWPDYVPPETLVSVNTGQTNARLMPVRLDELRPELGDYYGVHGPYPDWAALRQTPSRFFLTHYENEVTLQEVGTLGLPLPTTPPLATFGAEDIRLVTAVTTQEGDHLTLQLGWDIETPLPDVTVFVHVVDEAGQLVAQADGDLLGNSYPFALAPAHSFVVDVREMAVNGRIQLGLYNRLTGERLAAFGNNGTPLPDNSLSLNQATQP